MKNNLGDPPKCHSNPAYCSVTPRLIHEAAHCLNNPQIAAHRLLEGTLRVTATQKSFEPLSVSIKGGDLFNARFQSKAALHNVRRHIIR